MVTTTYLVSALLVAAMASDFTLTKLTTPNPSTAKCIDGTPPAYYHSPGHGSGAKKWLLFHEGGGWCINIEDCYQRSLMWFGSSNVYPPTITLDYGYFSSDHAESPFWNWNKVYLKYCDGGSFTGNNMTVSYHNGSPLYFRGFHNLQAMRNSLWATKGLDKAREVVIGGCSAGGLSTFLHIDWWADHLARRSKVRGLADSGFFPDLNSDLPDGGKFGNEMRWVFNQMNSTMDKDCLSENRRQKAKCIFAEHVIPHVETPFFLMQATYDMYQTDFLLGATDWFTGEISNAPAVNEYGDYFLELIADTVIADPKHGVFLDSCHHHCFGSLTTTSVDGVSIANAWRRWYSPNVNIQQNPFPCVDCCPSI